MSGRTVERAGKKVEALEALGLDEKVRRGESLTREEKQAVLDYLGRSKKTKTKCVVCGAWSHDKSDRMTLEETKQRLKKGIALLLDMYQQKTGNEIVSIHTGDNFVVFSEKDGTETVESLYEIVDKKVSD